MAANGETFDGEPFMRLQTVLKKEKLYVSAERAAIRDAYMQVDELCDQVMRLAWKTQRLNWGLDQVLSRQQSIEQWEKSRRTYDNLQLTTAHSRFGGHGTNYEAFVAALKRHPRLLAEMLVRASERDTDALVHTVLFAIYGGFFVPRDEMAVLDVIKHVVVIEMHKTPNAHGFLRSSSVVSRLFTCYARNYTLGRQYLLAALKDPILSVLADDSMNLEIEPAKVFMSLPEETRNWIRDDIAHSAEAGAGGTESIPDVRDLMSHPLIENMLSGVYAKIVQMCRIFIDSLGSTLHAMPYGIRFVSRLLLEALAGLGLGKESSRGVLGDFLFLRFISPAIVHPEPFGVVTDTPISNAARRNLTLIAKVLHGLATAQSGSTAAAALTEKDYYMVPLYVRLEDVSMEQLFGPLGSVANPDASLGYPPGSADMSGIDRKETVLLTTNELYSLQESFLHTAKAIQTSEVAGGKKGGGGLAYAALERIIAIADKLPAVPPESQRRISETDVIVFNVGHGPEPALLSEQQVLGAVYGSSTPPVDSLEPAERQTAHLIADVKKKLRLVLCSIDFSYQWRERDIMQILDSELWEARALGDGVLTAHLQETMRCLDRLPEAYKRNRCEMLLRAMEAEYEDRAPYITYLAKAKQRCLVTIDILKRHLKRVQRDCQVCTDYFNVVKIRRCLEMREPEVLEFVEQFHQLFMIDEKVRLVYNFLQRTMEQLRTDPMWEGATEDELEETGHMMEKHFMCRIYTSAFFPQREIDQQKDEIFLQYLENIRRDITVDHEALQISPLHQSEAPWPAAQRLLRDVNAYKAPDDKLRCITNCCKCIMDLVQMSGKPASADDLFPILVYVILQANPAHLLSTVQYIKYFYADRATGEGQYWWTQFTIAIEFIKTMDQRLHQS